MPEVSVLGRFLPSQLDAETIKAEFAKLPWLPTCCRAERVNLRIPMGIAPNPANLLWHQDGGGKDGTTRHMIVWASEQSTELKTSAGVVVRPKPQAVVWVDNHQAFHRQPAGTDESKRWWLSIQCSGAQPTTAPRYVLTRPAGCPPDVTMKDFDGQFYRVIKTPNPDDSMTITEIPVCEDCWQEIPRYVDFPRGLVSPESDGDREGQHIKIRMAPTVDGKEGIQHVPKVVCRDCYLAAFGRMYPDRRLPTLRVDVLAVKQIVPPPIVACESIDEPKAR